VSRIPIKLEWRGHLGKADIVRPLVLCEACRREVDSTTGGIYAYDGNSEAFRAGEPIEAFACTRASATGRSTFGAAWPERWPWREIRWLGRYLREILDPDDRSGAA
jgi:hypothetical protein